jgi:MFS superfamily sulfate permease-like transporter
LFLPIAAAVGIGVVLSLLLQLNQEAMDLTVVELVPTDGDQFREQPAPRILTSHQVTVLDVYGSLLYAGARTLQARLPEVAGRRAPAVVLPCASERVRRQGGRHAVRHARRPRGLSGDVLRAGVVKATRSFPTSTRSRERSRRRPACLRP